MNDGHNEKPKNDGVCPTCHSAGRKQRLSRLEHWFGAMPHFLRPFMWAAVIIGILSLFIGGAVAIATGHGLSWLLHAFAGGA